MTTLGFRFRFALAPLVAAGLVVLVPSGQVRAADEADAISLAPHLAIYDLKLDQRRPNKRSLQAVRGRIVYDFQGSSCEGYALQFRQVTELDSGEGKTAVSDLRSVTWEDGLAKRFRFNSQNFLNRELVEMVDGTAEHTSDNVVVNLVKPESKKLEIGRAAFPAEHMRRILAAARAEKTLLELTVYDGSENGEEIYQSLTVIGKKLGPDEKKPTDAAAKIPALANLDRWPVTISYFDKSKESGEQTPVYAISFELYDNGISHALILDYGDFSVLGEMTSLEVKDTKPCQ